MSRRAGGRLALAALAVAAVLGLWWLRAVPIGEAEADIIADALFRAYVAEVGEVAAHFTGPDSLALDDGWEYRWIYEPCRETAELRIFVSETGRAQLGLTPDCAPVRGFAVPPQRA